ncbi:hypothetical protein K431DRAFT_293339 [Polychaeton citri CBS 116435]|uniref:Uncharacterized protein n=1 Tax=Polychaeton citri CBS 116435 TaxID=1314669 RepID=A0A9P4QAZ9_9PEZI|nr:hypothetical protein K431DRAFT_293339 [Polychaeton citri CBS 116435]
MTTTPVDRIEDQLGPWRHQTWGFVIYRSTYASDADFAAVIAHLKAETAESLEHFGASGRPVARQLAWTIVEDCARLDGASKAYVRELFDQWCQSAEAAAEQPESAHPVAHSPSARYAFCVHVDQAAADSLKTSPEPWVNLVMRRWPYGQQDQDDDDDGEDDGDEEDEEELEEIEGSTEEDVGWCKVKHLGLQPGTYALLSASNAWYRFYQRPPAVV